MDDVFRTVICGIDGSAEALATARLASRLAPPDAAVELVAVDHVDLAVHAGWSSTAVLEQLAVQTKEAIEAAVAACAGIRAVTGRVVEGEPTAALLDEIRRLDATVVALGARGHSRAVGILLGGVTTTLVHDAPCSVLVGRGSDALPRRIVVRDDHSEASTPAVEAARSLAARTGMTVEVVHSEDAEAVDALLEAATPDALLVVGSRGLKGLRALGSVSERVAHRARCPVLVLRAADPKGEHR